MPAHDLSDAYVQTQTRIASAATQAGRSPQSVGLVAISKGHRAETIRHLAQLGQRDFGENYLQEALPKMAELLDLKLTWHFTGQIQSNKTRQIAENFDWAHTVDRERIAARLNEQRPAHLPPLNVCIEVSLEDEAGKGGIGPNEVEPLARSIVQMPRLRLRGLMALPPPQEEYSEQKRLFDRLAEVLRKLNERQFALDTLSMGMSADLEAAVAAGATLVRVGTAIFGERARANP
ncbi:MAG: YggS family pyridoxal phosphate-dependent enzyme [Povalibacter sp.]